jgi:hypothetical protein
MSGPEWDDIRLFSLSGGVLRANIIKETLAEEGGIVKTAVIDKRSSQWKTPGDEHEYAND